MSEDFCINLIYGTGGNKWTHHMDDANAGGAKVLEWDLRCFDERKPFTRYQAWVDVTFKDPAGKETKNVRIGPQEPFNLATAGNSTRWSFKGTETPSPLAGTMEIELRKATESGKQTLGDPVLFKDTKWLGNQVRPTASATGAPDTKKVPLGTYTCWIVDRFKGPDKGHRCWGDDSLEKMVLARLQWWLGDAMNRIAKKTGSFDDAKIEYVTEFPKARKPQELVVYLSSTKGGKYPARLIGAVPGAAPSHGGSSTKRGKEYLSEVYPEKISWEASPDRVGDMTGKLIAHEWMHILLDVDTPGVDVVHKRGSGIGAEIVTEATDLTDDDAEVMAKLLLVDRAFVKA